MKGFSLVFPAYNEEENLDFTITSALEVGESLGAPFEIIVVNDGSQDRTKEVIVKYQNQFNNVFLVDHETNKGYGQTLRDGFSKAKYNWVFFADSDRQFDLKEIKKLIKQSDKADLVIGYRVNRQDNSLRKLNAYLFKLSIKTFFNIKVRDIDCAFKLMKKEVLDNVKLVSTGALINTELLHKSLLKKYKIVEVPVSHYPRIKGSATGANVFVIFRAIKEMATLRIAS